MSSLLVPSGQLPTRAWEAPGVAGKIGDEGAKLVKGRKYRDHEYIYIYIFLYYIYI